MTRSKCNILVFLASLGACSVDRGGTTYVPVPDADMPHRGNITRTDAGRDGGAPDLGAGLEVRQEVALPDTGSDLGVEAAGSPDAGREVAVLIDGGSEVLAETGNSPDAGREAGAEALGSPDGRQVEVSIAPGFEDAGRDVRPDVGRSGKEAGAETVKCSAACYVGCNIGCGPAGQCIACNTCTCEVASGTCHC